jgi:hypothetical protein
MKKARIEEAAMAATAQKPRKAAFCPTPAQRGFVAGAAGFGVPRRVICQMLPGVNPGETMPISAHMLRDYFPRELRQGLKLVVALAGARVCQRALSGDDRAAHAAQLALLNNLGWEVPAESEDDDPPLDMRALTFAERDQLRTLIEKAMAARESDIEASAAEDARQRRARWQRAPRDA